MYGNELHQMQVAQSSLTYDLLTSISAGLITTVIVAIVLPILSIRVRKILIALFSKLCHSDVLYVYKDKKDAESDLEKSLGKATYVRLLTARGNDFQHDVFKSLIDPLNPKEFIQVLLPNPYIFDSTDWIEQREQELRKIDSTYGDEILKDQIKTRIKGLLSMNKEGLKIRLHQSPIVGRLLITNQFVFFTPMLPSGYIRNSPIYKYDANSTMGLFYKRFFEQLWETGTNVNTK
jgi:hypothetical protein